MSSPSSQQPLPSVSTAIADQYAAAVLRRKVSSDRENRPSTNNMVPQQPIPSRTTSKEDNNSSNGHEDSLAYYEIPRSSSLSHSSSSRSHSISRRNGKPSTPRKPVPVISTVIDENDNRISSNSEYTSTKSKFASISSGNSNTNTNSNSNTNSLTYTNSMSNKSYVSKSDVGTQISFESKPDISNDENYVPKDKLIKLHNILLHTQTADECRLMVDAFLKSLKVPIGYDEVNNEERGLEKINENSDCSAESSTSASQAVEIDHASSYASLPKQLEESEEVIVNSNAKTPTEVTTPLTPTASTPYPNNPNKQEQHSLQQVKTENNEKEGENNFVTKWLNDSTANQELL